jgi:hypothetical protein
MAKGPQPREGETRQIEGLALENVIERARGRDDDALEEIYRRYVRRVFGLCRYMLDSRESAEDATSEVFLKLQRTIESYDGSIPFPRWVLRVAGNQCIDVLRRRQLYSARQQRIYSCAAGISVVLSVLHFFLCASRGGAPRRFRRLRSGPPGARPSLCCVLTCPRPSDRCPP